MVFHMEKGSSITLMVHTMLGIFLRGLLMAKEGLLVLMDGFMRGNYRISKHKAKEDCTINKLSIGIQEIGQEIFQMVMANNYGNQKK